MFLTSNNTRELSDALKRRCLHLYISFPYIELEMNIIKSRVPDISQRLCRQLVSFVHQIRELDLKKQPAISETIDWARTLLLMHAQTLDLDVVKDTLNVLLKHEEDIANVSGELYQLLNKK